jgi:hypothetical protein
VSIREGHNRVILNCASGEPVAELARIVTRAQARPMAVEAGLATAFGGSSDGAVAAVVRDPALKGGTTRFNQASVT